MRIRGVALSLGWAGVMLALGTPTALAVEGTPPLEVSDLGLSPVVAPTPYGFVVVWQQGSDHSHGRVFARRIDPLGRPVGDAFEVDAEAPGRQAFPSLASDRAGRFVVAWNHDAFTPGSHTNVRFRRFGADGAPLGPAILANSSFPAYYGYPSVAMEPSGGFAIAWVGSSGNWVRRFTRSGTPTAPERIVTRPWDYETFAISLAFPGGARPPSLAAVWSVCLHPVCSGVGQVLRFLRPGGKPLRPVLPLGEELADPRVLTGAEGEVLVIAASDPAGALTVQRWSADARLLATVHVQDRPSCAPGTREGVVAAAFQPPRHLAVVRPGIRVADDGQTVDPVLWVEVLDVLRGGRVVRCESVVGGEAADELGASVAFGRKGQILVTWTEGPGGVWNPTPEPMVEAAVLARR